jgi:hypothetical protein
VASSKSQFILPKQCVTDNGASAAHIRLLPLNGNAIMESYLIRIYRHSLDPLEVIGIIETVDKQNASRPFLSWHELTELLKRAHGRDKPASNSTSALKKSFN